MTSTRHHLGSLPVAPLALGAMNFGTTVDPAAAFECLDAARELGVTFWDTANNYAFWQGTGDESETVLGDWFTDRGPAARDEIVLATKLGARPAPGFADFAHAEGLSAAAIRSQLTGSLQRLRTDHVDVLYAHIDDPAVPLAETLGEFGALVEEGLVREVAASNLHAPRLAEALAVPIAHPYRALQQRFTYLPVDPAVDITPHIALDDETIDVATAADVTLIGYSPLLSGAYTRADRPLPEQYLTPQLQDRLAALAAAAGSTGLDVGQLVLAWMTQRSTAVIPVVGVSTPQQVQAAWTAVTRALPDDLLNTLDAARR